LINRIFRTGELQEQEGDIMARFGTIEVYEEMADLLNSDEDWAELGRAITYTMVYVFEEPVDKTFYLRFEQGKITDVRELESSDAEAADFILTAAPGTWRGIFEKKLKAPMALATGKIKVNGDLGTLMKHMKAFNHVLDALTRIELV
jgi:putative sterol carrier protein